MAPTILGHPVGRSVRRLSRGACTSGSCRSRSSDTPRRSRCTRVLCSRRCSRGSSSVHLRPLAQNPRGAYGCGDLFAVLFVGDTVDLDVRDLGVGIEELFDLARVDVLAPADDHILRPARDPDVPIFVHYREVTGVQPPLVVYDLAGLLLHVVVATHDVVAAGPQFALLFGPSVLVRLHVDDANLYVGELASHAGYPQLQRVVGPGLGYDGARLGLAVGDGDLRGAHHVDDVLHDLHGARGAGHYAGAQRTGIALLEIWMLKLRNEHGRDPEERCAPFLVYSLQHLLGVEALDGDHRPLMRDSVEGAKNAAEAVEERDRYADPVFRPQLHALADVEGVLDDVGVGQLHTLREARRPRGVLHVDDLFRVKRGLPLAQLLIG